MKIQQIRNATIIIEYAGVRILVDPWLAPKESNPPLLSLIQKYFPLENKDIKLPVGIGKNFPFCELPLEIKDIIKVDAVLATHLHFDHFDEVAAKSIPHDMPMFSQDEVDAEQLRGFGFSNVIILPDEGSYDFKGVLIHKTPCNHGVEEIYRCFPFRREASGFVLTSPKESKKIYVVGDSVLYQGVKDTIEHFHPDVIVVNACAATTPLGRLIMDAEEVKETRNLAPYATIIVSHMDAVPHAMITSDEMRKFIQEQDLKNVLVPANGEIITL
ncbi:MBL fold metallo-hydrolase [Histomonas meleagridis]|uniref:MBL fold metallo-hydrolase n=1 Tax=Histomonas meleagridis TaxID=135588 RepID=UPI0035594AA7|nr:MBL fold metallo-hydrolase [Histomonas meleagridis]KAH0796750.1 MBL fold metallo-hydrolase [Histomonas meleagridis]